VHPGLSPFGNLKPVELPLRKLCFGERGRRLDDNERKRGKAPPRDPDRKGNREFKDSFFPARGWEGLRRPVQEHSNKECGPHKCSQNPTRKISMVCPNNRQRPGKGIVRFGFFWTRPGVDRGGTPSRAKSQGRWVEKVFFPRRDHLGNWEA